MENLSIKFRVCKFFRSKWKNRNIFFPSQVFVSWHKMKYFSRKKEKKARASAFILISRGKCGNKKHEKCFLMKADFFSERRTLTTECRNCRTRKWRYENEKVAQLKLITAFCSLRERESKKECEQASEREKYWFRYFSDNFWAKQTKTQTIFK